MSHTKAVIYCRVSTEKQKNELDGLSSQEDRCREHANYKGYEVVKVFRDEGVSGSLIDRPAMKEMLHFLRRNKKDDFVVLIFDITRFARGIDAHIALRSKIASTGARLESPSMEFIDDDPDRRLNENVLACFSQHFREVISKQTTIRMASRFKKGYWVNKTPIGYKFTKVPEHAGKFVVRDEPLASFIQEVLEGYATDRFETQCEVKRFLENSPLFLTSRKTDSPEVTYQAVRSILENPFYAGYMNSDTRKLYLQPGQHEPLISFETWKTIQDKMAGNARAPFRKDTTEDFILRGFITCDTCQKPMTACWSKGRSSKYPYYLCFTKGCVDYRKSIRREKVENEFEDLLQSLRPTEGLFNLAKAMFGDLWKERGEQIDKETVLLKKHLVKIENQTRSLVQRIVAATNETLISTYENELQKLEEEKILMNEKIANCGRPLRSFDESFRTAFGFLSNPCNLWQNGSPEERRLVLRLTFAERLKYHRKEGFRTAETTLPFKVLGALQGGENKLASPGGFEPPSPA